MIYKPNFLKKRKKQNYYGNFKQKQCIKTILFINMRFNAKLLKN